MLKHIYVYSRSRMDNGMRALGLVAMVVSGESGDAGALVLELVSCAEESETVGMG